MGQCCNESHAWLRASMNHYCPPPFSSELADGQNYVALIRRLLSASCHPASQPATLTKPPLNGLLGIIRLCSFPRRQLTTWSLLSSPPNTFNHRQRSPRHVTGWQFFNPTCLRIIIIFFFTASFRSFEMRLVADIPCYHSFGDKIIIANFPLQRTRALSGITLCKWLCRCQPVESLGENFRKKTGRIYPKLAGEKRKKRKSPAFWTIRSPW